MVWNAIIKKYYYYYNVLNVCVKAVKAKDLCVRDQHWINICGFLDFWNKFQIEESLYAITIKRPLPQLQNPY